MPGQPCKICKDPEKLKIANAMIAAGTTDVEIIARIGVGRMSVQRHRTLHVMAPARALAIAAAKGRDVAERRISAVRAAEAGDEVKAFLGLEEITRDARGISKDLKKARKATKAAGQFSVMTGIVNQEHNNLNLRGRLGNLPGMVPQKLNPAEAAIPFNLTIHMPGQSKTLSFTPAEGIPEPSHHMIEHVPAAVEMVPSLPADGAWGDGDQDELDKILACVFDKPKPDDMEEPEPAPAPRRGRSLLPRGS